MQFKVVFDVGLSIKDDILINWHIDYIWKQWSCLVEWLLNVVASVFMYCSYLMTHENCTLLFQTKKNAYK